MLALARSAGLQPVEKNGRNIWHIAFTGSFPERATDLNIQEVSCFVNVLILDCIGAAETNFDHEESSFPPCLLVNVLPWADKPCAHRVSIVKTPSVK